MEKTTLKSMVQAGLVTAISKLRFNQSSYPYVTLLHGSDSQNLYFGKKSANVIGAKYAEGESILAELKNADIILTKNEAGEERFKLSLPSESSNYSSQSEMDEIFGMAEQEIAFDTNKFRSLFASRAEEEHEEPKAAIKAAIKPAVTKVTAKAVAAK